MNKSRFTKELVARMAKMRAQGNTFKQIGHEYNCAGNTVKKKMQEFGFKDPLARKSCNTPRSGVSNERITKSKEWFATRHEAAMLRVKSMGAAL